MACPKVVTNDYSQTIGTTAVQIFAVGQLQRGLNYYRLWNVAATGGGTIWLSRAGVAGVNAPGSYPLLPGQFEEFKPPAGIPANGLSAIATAAGTPLTVEVG